MQPKFGFRTNIKPKKLYQTTTYSRQKVNLRAKTAVKDQSSAAKRMKNDQTYQNVLNRLLRLNNLKIFYQQSSKYVIFKDEYIQNFNISKQGLRRSLRLVASLGSFLLKDGGFIKHYSHLLQNYYPQKKQEIRKNIFQIYNQNIDIRIGMFDKYFAKERNLQIQYVISTNFDKKQNSNIIMKPVKLDKVPQVNKIQRSEKYQENLQTTAQNTTQFAHSKLQNQNLLNNSYDSQKSKSIKQNPETGKKSSKKKSVNKNSSKKQLYSYADGQNSYDRQKKVQQYQKQLQNKSKKKETQRKSIRFQDQIKINPILKQCYEEILQIQEMRKSIANSSKKQVTSATQRYLKSLPRVKPQFRDLTQSQKFGLLKQEKQLLEKWPEICLIAEAEGVKVVKQAPLTILGSFKDYKLAKALIQSKNQKFIEWGLIMIPLKAQQKQEYKQNKFQIDDGIFLFVQKLTPELEQQLVKK